MRRRFSRGGDPRWISAKYQGTCSCGATIQKGARAYYFPNGKTIKCETCGETEAASFEGARFDEAQYTGGW